MSNPVVNIATYRLTNSSRGNCNVYYLSAVVESEAEVKLYVATRAEAEL